MPLLASMTAEGKKPLMRIDNRAIHAPTVLLSLESNNSEIKMLFIFAEAPYGDTPEPPRHHFTEAACLAS